nr:PEP-CTERM sorting domain-containing protein [uncultured Roseateles sp.]
MMTTLKHSLLAAAALALCGAAQAAAPKFSDNFSSLANWTLLGDVSSYSGYGVMTTASSTEGDDFPMPNGAANLSGNNPVDANAGPAGIEAFVGLATGALNLSAIDKATEGSAIKRSFDVKAGDKLSVDWLLVTNDTGTGFGLDYGFAVIDGHFIPLASASNANTPFAQPYPWSTAPGHLDYTFQHSGTINVAFGVVDVLDRSASTALGIDQLSLTAAVPEPGTYGLMMAGLGLLCTVARRRSSK